MKLKYFYLFALTAVFFSCKENKTAQLPPQEINVYQVSPQDVPIHEEFVGQVYGEKDISIRARVEGFLDKIYFEEGSEVKKGQLLYAIDPDPFLEAVAAQKSMVSQAETMLVQKESDLSRIKPLAEMDAVSKRDLDMAQAQRDAAISSLDAAKANLNIANINLGYTKVYAPINGLIGKTLAREGEFVGKDPNPVILNTVSEIKTVRIQFFLSENQYITFKRNFIENKVEINDENSDFHLQLILADGSLYEKLGRIDFIDRNVDPSTGAILVQASFVNHDGFIRPGQFARIRAQIRLEKNALLVPQKCVTELQGQYSVFAVDAENKVVAKQVKIGETFRDYYIIKEGLKPNDKVVLEGLQKVKTGMVVIPNTTEFNSQIKAQ